MTKSEIRQTLLNIAQAATARLREPDPDLVTIATQMRDTGRLMIDEFFSIKDQPTKETSNRESESPIATSPSSRRTGVTAVLGEIVPSK